MLASAPTSQTTPESSQGQDLLSLPMSLIVGESRCSDPENLDSGEPQSAIPEIGPSWPSRMKPAQ